MPENNKSSEKDFDEWMVTKALAKYLGSKGKEDTERMARLFSLQAQTPGGQHPSQPISELCGFDWGDDVKGGPEEFFRDDRPSDRGAMVPEKFKTYLLTSPDFRYWTREGESQLIIEAKNTQKPSGRRDLVQAERYFSYFPDSGHKGAIVYVVPNPKHWLKWLEEVAGVSTIRFGVVDINDQIVPMVSNELVRVVGETLVKNGQLLNKALRSSTQQAGQAG